MDFIWSKLSITSIVLGHKSLFLAKLRIITVPIFSLSWSGNSIDEMFDSPIITGLLSVVVKRINLSVIVLKLYGKCSYSAVCLNIAVNGCAMI